MKKSSTQKGFTLIEIIVSLAIFTIVAVIAVGAFLKIVDANTKSQTLKTAINNVNFALESMTREMRVGSIYTCYTIPPSSIGPTLTGFGQSCTQNSGPGSVVVAFKSSKKGTGSVRPVCNLIYAYLIDDDTATAVKTIKKAEQQDCDSAIVYPDSFVQVVSSDAVIDDHFLDVVTAVSSANGPQPKVFLRLKGHAGNREKNKTYFDVQTTISQRNQF